MSAVETPSTMAPATLSELMSVWRARDVEEWSRSPGTYRTLAEKILGKGEPLDKLMKKRSACSAVLIKTLLRAPVRNAKNSCGAPLKFTPRLTKAAAAIGRESTPPP